MQAAGRLKTHHRSSSLSHFLKSRPAWCGRSPKHSVPGSALQNLAVPPVKSLPPSLSIAAGVIPDSILGIIVARCIKIDTSQSAGDINALLGKCQAGPHTRRSIQANRAGLGRWSSQRSERHFAPHVVLAGVLAFGLAICCGLPVLNLYRSRTVVPCRFRLWTGPRAMRVASRIAIQPGNYDVSNNDADGARTRNLRIDSPGL